MQSFEADFSIEINNLLFKWPRATAPCLVLDRLHIPAAAQVLVHGRSGCGKSTLLHLLAGVLVAERGAVRVLGQDCAALSSVQRDAWRAANVGYVFQQFNLLPYLSAVDNVILPCQLNAQRRQRACAPLLTRSDAALRDAARASLAAMELPESAWHRPAASLSIGQQQRVAAARALLGAPALVLADEPTSALDPASRDAFLHLLQHACHRAASTLVVVSHDVQLHTHFEQRIALDVLNRA